MKKGLITNVDIIDDLVYGFYKEFDTKFLKEKPEYRFLLLSSLLNDLCQFNLADNSGSFHYLIDKISQTKAFNTDKSKKICSTIKLVVGNPTYFAASYWSPIDRKRHTISHSVSKNSEESEHYARAAALLFYILTYKAPPKFHSAINYIATDTPLKDGLHSHYGEKHPYKSISEEHQYQVWCHIPERIHGELLSSSSFESAIEQLILFDKDTIKKSLTVLMENLNDDEVEAEIQKYENTYQPIIEKVDSFKIPKNLSKWANEFNVFLNDFFYPGSLPENLKAKLTLTQSFYMACTHILYNKACPTKMFYTFPVRVADTCCVLTLGVNTQLSVQNILAMSHIVKSIYYHGLDRDYQALNALERNRIAHGAVHKIRGPLNILKEFPYELQETLESNLSENEFKKISSDLNTIKSNLRSSIENILIGVKSLENFIDIEQPKKFNLYNIIINAKKTYERMKVKTLESLEISHINENPNDINIYGVPSHVQFIFEELISNSIRAFKFNKANNSSKKLIIRIGISEDNENSSWIVNFTDNGSGISDDKKNKIFFSGIRGRDSGGSGKGLFLSKLFLNKYGNDIVECGEFGVGVNFKLTFKKY